MKLKSRGMLRLDDETYGWLVDEAATRGVPVSAIVREAIQFLCRPENAE